MTAGEQAREYRLCGEYEHRSGRGRERLLTVQAITPNISLSAVTDINLTGLVQADGSDQQDAGVIAILAGEDIAVGAGAVISADGQGQNSSGGDIRVMAENEVIWLPGRACQLMAEVQVMAGLLNFQPVMWSPCLAGLYQHQPKMASKARY